MKDWMKERMEFSRRYQESKRIEEITKILEDNPDMWHRAKAGFKAERTRLINKLNKETGR